MNVIRRSWIAAALAVSSLAAPSGATGTAFVSIVAAGQATVTLTGPDGSTLTQVTNTGDISLSPKSSGPHKISVTVGGKTTTGEVIIPESGQVRVIFNPAAQTPFESYVAAVESVTVTAQRVEESLQKVPVAVTAFDNKQLEIKQITNVQQASYSTPNLWMEKNSHDRRREENAKLKFVFFQRAQCSLVEFNRVHSQMAQWRDARKITFILKKQKSSCFQPSMWLVNEKLFQMCEALSIFVFTPVVAIAKIRRFSVICLF